MPGRHLRLRRQELDPEQLLCALARERATFTLLVPTHFS